jgi:hypothetical protein
VINGGDLNPEQKLKMDQINLLGDEIFYDTCNEDLENLNPEKKVLEHRRIKSGGQLAEIAEKRHVKRSFAPIEKKIPERRREEESQEGSNHRLSYLIEKKIIAETVISKCCIPNDFKLKKSLK